MSKATQEDTSAFVELVRQFQADGMDFIEASKAAAQSDAGRRVMNGHQSAPAAAAAEAPAAPVKRLVVTSAADIKPVRTKWLWDRRIPVGAISLLAGREGIGKSTVVADLIGQITRGELSGEMHGQGRSVFIVATEDAWEPVIVPRLMAAGADMTRVFRAEATTETGVETLVVPRDLTELAADCQDRGAVLVVLDALMSVIDHRADTHKDRDVRKGLDPLRLFAETTHVAVLGLIHVNKSGGTDALNSIMGSRAFTAVARSVLFCLSDPDAEKDDRFLLGHAKSNFGPKQATVGYRIEGLTLGMDLDSEVDEPIETSRVAWLGEDGRSVREVLEDAAEPPRRGDSELTARILAWMAEQVVAPSAGEVAAAFPEIKRGTLDKHLSRMVERGRLARPVQGHYSLPNNKLPDGA